MKRVLLSLLLAVAEVMGGRVVLLGNVSPLLIATGTPQTFPVASHAVDRR